MAPALAILKWLAAAGLPVVIHLLQLVYSCPQVRGLFLDI